MASGVQLLVLAGATVALVLTWGHWARLATGRTPFTDGLGNFLTIELGMDALPVVEAFASHGVGIRPLTPYGMLEQVRVSVGTPDQTDDFLEAAADVPAPDPFAGATAQAVRVSVKPNPRPGNFDTIVQRSQRQAAQEETRTAAVAVPRDQRMSPGGPTPTTVARAATEKNAIKLRRVNLIGVYGTSSNRRALVRLANGRYQKVKVGDRLDGGRVAAIGTSELRYVKSGRQVTLTMPRG